MSITEGDLVKFKKGLYKDEEGAIYRVLEINGDRAFVELVNTNMVIRPQSVAMLSELEKLNSDSIKAELK
jgi:ribosomal protein L24